MSRRRSRTQRMQLIIAIVLLVCMAGSGLALYGAVSSNQPTQQQPSGQGR